MWVTRDDIAEELILSMAASERDGLDAAWLAEVQRRDESYRDESYRLGKSVAHNVNFVIQRLQTKARS